MMERGIGHSLLGLLWIALAGCATVATVSDGDAADRQVAIDTHTLLADVALDRQRFETAADEMMQAALLADHPWYAERTARLAHQVELTELGVQAAERWKELAPEDERPFWFAGVFQTRSNRLARATAEFREFVGAVGDPATGLALVLEALADEPYAEAATAIMSSLTAAYPGTGAGHYALARLALRSGDFPLALENAQAATDSDPAWLDAQLLYARTLLVAGRTADSLQIGARLAEQHEEDVEVQLQYAELLLSAGQPDEAEALLNEILEDDPGLPEAVRALAFLALTEERLELAEQHFNELRGDARYRSEAFYYLGRIAETEREFQQATRSYSRVTEGTHAVEAQLRTARIMFAELGDPDGAVRHLRDFGEANPRFASNMLVAQSQLLLQMEQPDQAMQIFDTALAEAPDDPTLHAAHVQLFAILAQDAVDRGALDEAQSLLSAGLERYTDDASLRYSQALLYEEQGKMRKAVTVLENLVDESPDDAALLNALGYLLTDQFDRHGEARGYIQKALAMDPDNPAIIDSMGWVLFRLGEHRAALDYLERAYRLEDDPEIAAHLVDVRWALGERDAALELLRSTLEKNPESRHLKEVSERLSQ
jgi:tetratricopeptide (TPR) repeat protein